MDKSFLRLDDLARREIYTSAAPDLGLSPEIIEKDVWLCQVLEALFSIPDVPLLVFRGGTSLSKAFNAIERFSEDVDVTINHEELLPETKDFFRHSKSRQKKLLDTLHEKATQLLKEKIFPTLKDTLGDCGDVQFDADAEQTLLFAYNSCLDESISPYVAKNIRLEFGSRGSTEPSIENTIRPYLSELYQELNFPEAKTQVISATRTFWDKVTLIHAEINRFDKGKIRKALRTSRHWYDLYRLSLHETGKKAMSDDSYLLSDVVRHKSVFFRDASSEYTACLEGGTKLMPGAEMLQLLERDYKQMVEAGMLYGNRPSFEEILDQLQALEKLINEISKEGCQ